MTGPRGPARQFPFLGHGVGLRVRHYPLALSSELDVDWVEVTSENFFGGGGRPRAVLEALRRQMPVVFHGVSLGVGGVDGPRPSYLDSLKELVDAYEPAWVSDHLCFTHFRGLYSHDLLPLPYTEEALSTVVRGVSVVQEALGRPILLENVSSYVAFAQSQLSEWEFLAEVARRSGCSILLDLNNVIVSAHNHGFSPDEYLAGMPPERVAQFHLANHSDLPGYKFDDHCGAVPEVVWSLYERAVERFGAVSSLVEWDEDVPDWPVLRAECREAKARAERVLEARGALDGVAAPSPAPARQPVPSVATARGQEALDLESSQRAFFEAIAWPTGVESFLAEAARPARESFERRFAGSSRMSAPARVDVYANAYFYRQSAALAEMFPRTSWLLGEVAFHNFVTDYVLACPSREPDLRRLGDRLPAFLATHELARRHPLLVELSTLELSENRAVDDPNGRPLTAEVLRELSPDAWPALRLRLTPPTRLLSSHWDLEGVDAAYGRGDRAAAIDLPRREPVCYLCGRRRHAVYFRALQEDEAAALWAFESGVDFAGTCEAVKDLHPSFDAARMVSHLGRWLSDGAIELVG